MRFRNVLTLGDGGGIKRIQLPTAECDDKIPTKGIGRSSWEDLGRLLGGGDLCADYGWDRESDREREAAQCGVWHERHNFRALGGEGAAILLLDSSRGENGAEVQPWSISLPDFWFLKVCVFPLRVPIQEWSSHGHPWKQIPGLSPLPALQPSRGV